MLIKFLLIPFSLVIWYFLKFIIDLPVIGFVLLVNIYYSSSLVCKTIL